MIMNRCKKKWGISAMIAPNRTLKSNNLFAKYTLTIIFFEKYFKMQQYYRFGVVIRHIKTERFASYKVESFDISN